MKNIKLFILESLNNKLLTVVRNLNYDFSETASLSNNTKENRAKRAKAQEKIFIDLFNELTDKDTHFDYKAISCEDYCKLINKTYSFIEDSKIGDIIIMNDKTPEMFIDLKVAETNKYIGTPDMLSLVNFASERDDKKYYLCSSLDGSQKKLILANEIYNIIISKKGNVIVSKDRNHISKEVEAFKDKVKLVAPKNMESADLSKLYDEDFVATSVITNIK